MVVVHNRKLTKHYNITHAKNCLGRQGLAQKPSQTFGNTSVQQNIVKSIIDNFLDLQ